MKSIALAILLLLFISSCAGQDNPNLSSEYEENSQQVTQAITQDLNSGVAQQIAKYIVEIFEDKKGNLWFGTMAKGVARYDGKGLTYFSTKDGLCGNTVSSIAEDKEGNLWFGTHSGLSKYDGRSFTNFTKNEGLCDDRISNILIDRVGDIWIGTWEGVCRYNGTTFSIFDVPNPDVEIPSYQETMNWVTEIMEDSQGNIWFCRSGYSACKYDGDSFTHFTKRDGLASNCVQTIQEDRQGNIWFGSRVAEKDHPDPVNRTGDGGLSRYDGKTFVQYPQLRGLSENDIYAIYEDKIGNIWIGANGVGVYRYDGDNFTLFNETDKADVINGFGGIQSILEDRNGTVWLGASGGLFRLNGSSIINVTQNGPWKSR